MSTICGIRDPVRSQAEALQKARKMKAEALGIKAPASCTK